MTLHLIDVTISSMHSTTDIVILSICGIFFLMGYSRGFLRTVFRPFALILGAAFGYLYYKNTQNIIIATLISFIAPFLLNMAFSFMLKFWVKLSNQSTPLFSFGRLMGGVLNTVWAGGMILLFMMLLTFIPMDLPGLKNVTKDIKASKSYDVIDQQFKGKFKHQSKKINNLATFLKGEGDIEVIRGSKNYNSIMKNKKMKKALSDDKTQKQIENMDVFGLMSNPNFTEIMEDEELVGQLLNMQNQIMNQGAGGSVMDEKKRGKTIKPVEVRPLILEKGRDF